MVCFWNAAIVLKRMFLVVRGETARPMSCVRPEATTAVAGQRWRVASGMGATHVGRSRPGHRRRYYAVAETWYFLASPVPDSGRGWAIADRGGSVCRYRCWPHALHGRVSHAQALAASQRGARSCRSAHGAICPSSQRSWPCSPGAGAGSSPHRTAHSPQPTPDEMLLARIL